MTTKKPVVRIATIRTQSKRAAKQCAIENWPDEKICSITRVNHDTFKVVLTSGSIEALTKKLNREWGNE